MNVPTVLIDILLSKTLSSKFSNKIVVGLAMQNDGDIANAKKNKYRACKNMYLWLHEFKIAICKCFINVKFPLLIYLPRRIVPIK